MAKPKSYLQQHRSGRFILRVHDEYCVLSENREWVLSKHASAEDALAWCDARWPDPTTVIEPANQPPENWTRRILSTDKGTWRELRLLGAVGEMRVATYQGREHLVLPVVACREAVLRPMNSNGPEFVPAEVLAVAPSGWNGRPCVGPHPVDHDGIAGSANEPALLERRAFGQVFNARFDPETTQLRVEAWIDAGKAAMVGEDAMSVVTRARRGEPIEVSIGAFVISEHAPGEYNGRPYEYIWRLAIPDHLALLPPEATGACSYEMGCGVRAAARPHIFTESGLIVDDQSPSTTEEPVNRGERIAALTAAKWVGEDKRAALEALSDTNFQVIADKYASAAADWTIQTGWRETLRSLVAKFTPLQKPRDMSDDDVRAVLSSALNDEIDGFRGVQGVWQPRGEVVYLVDPDPGGPTPLQWYRRRYALSEDGKVEWKGDPAACRPSVRYEAMAGEPAEPTAAAAGGCGCHKNDAAATGAADKGENAMHRNAQRIKALIDNTKTPWTAADQTYLEGMTDERLAEVEKFIPVETPVVETPKETPAPVAAAAAIEPPKETPKETPQADPKTLAEVDMAALPKPVREHFAKLAARDKARKTEMVAALKGAQDVYSETELAAMDVDALGKVMKLAGLAAQPDIEDADFTAMGVHRQPESTYTPPDPWEKGLAARAAAR